MSAAPDTNAKPPVPAQEPTRKMLAEENAALRARVADLEAQLTQAVADRDTLSLMPVGEEHFILLTTLKHDGKTYAPGALMPFNPEAPPKGSEGLVEGVVYERARVIVRDA